jgi:CRP-like cAMP-binding protein
MDNKTLAIVRIIDNNPVLYKIFKSCPYEILHYWEIKEYPAGTVFCNQGDIIDHFDIVVNGFVDVYFTNENGKRYNIATHKCGDIIGEIEFLEKKPFVCSVEAYTDLTVLEIKRDYFLKWIHEDRNISSYVIEVLSKRFHDYSLKVGNDLLYPLKVRICLYLLSRSKHLSKTTANIEVKINKEKLSEELAVTRRSIHRILRELQDKNIIAVKTDAIIVKDLERLTAEAETRRGDFQE